MITIVVNVNFKNEKIYIKSIFFEKNSHVCQEELLQVIDLSLMNQLFDTISTVNKEAFKSQWRRLLLKTNIEDLRFHDFRHEGISRLFEKGWSIQEVALVSGHQSWSSLKRYANLKEEIILNKL